MEKPSLTMVRALKYMMMSVKDQGKYGSAYQEDSAWLSQSKYFFYCLTDIKETTKGGGERGMRH